VHDDESLEHVRRVIEGYGHRMTDAHAVQCLFPAGADILPNPRGTACGFACWVGEAMAYAMPGVPEEMKAMFTGSVLPRLTGESRERVVMREVHTSGLPESRVNEALVTLLEIGRNPSVGLKARGGWVTVCIRARAATAEEAERLAEGDCRAVEERLGEAAFGRGEVTLAGALAQVLEERGLHLAVAESCTGGLIGSMLTDVPGVSSVLLLDVVAYDNAAKTRVLGVPAERIEAAGAVSGAEVGLSTTGVAGPAGGTARKPVGLVYVGMCLRGWTAVRELRIPGERQRVKDRAARYALDFARLEVLKESAETGSLGRRRRGEKACG
jgi:nicotinamide-nucleotide amidase